MSIFVRFTAFLVGGIMAVPGEIMFFAAASIGIFTIMINRGNLGHIRLTIYNLSTTVLLFCFGIWWRVKTVSDGFTSKGSDIRD